MHVVNLFVEDTNAVLNVRFSSAGTADTCYRLLQMNILLSALCVETNLAKITFFLSIPEIKFIN